ncbi:hypothetical protein [Myroides marinus]|uniref:Uncharacterized protein n=1 Tax=Myroides marinus TaxID=703342 RepID=A0A164A2I4_9FLAO|nr:hypothetical protein [Myroides marinus]KZE82880.1 hypothetical protein AV926_04850 [Myroides marinus]MDM1378807.1 hypothetical protein [Myroides marinus]MDM1386078.1 hypothetical protein [Myroides marinus]MDM1393291.1 hypothetical protein [Myroides marinus]
MKNKLLFIALLLLFINKSYSQETKTFAYNYVYALVTNSNDEPIKAEPIGKNAIITIDYFYKTITINYFDEINGTQNSKLRYSFTSDKGLPVFKDEEDPDTFMSAMYTQSIAYFIEYSNAKQKYGLALSNTIF